MTGIMRKLATTAATPAMIAIQPLDSAAMTFCFAAIATTMGMYIAFQKLIPDAVGTPNCTR